VVSGVLAGLTGSRRLAYGYAGYQNSWPEQTPLAVERLRAVLARYGIELELPVYDLASREAVVAELQAHGLSARSLEQKCLRQVTNLILSEQRLRQQVKLWESAIDCSMANLEKIELDVLSKATLGEFA
jgi:hypothetical protein